MDRYLKVRVTVGPVPGVMVSTTTIAAAFDDDMPTRNNNNKRVVVCNKVGRKNVFVVGRNVLIMVDRPVKKRERKTLCPW
jgi:hypothetical protein